MKKYKVMWNEPTEIANRLTKKAEAVLADTDPIEIREYLTDEGYRYDVVGCIEDYGLTEDDVNELFEDLYEEGL